MRKQTKLAVGISAAALLAVGASMTSLAATGWVNEDGAWYYYNASGDVVTNQWKSYNGQYFYLGEDGAMLTNQLIEDNGNYFFVDANGAMVKNQWQAIAATDSEPLDVEYRWYYFGATGKAYKSSVNKTIAGKKYGFDEEGKMLFGYVEGNSTIITDEEDPVLRAMYYFGTNEDGARHSGWLQYTDSLTDYNDDYYWFYFSPSNGKKQLTSKTINGKKYDFDGNNGIMLKEWTKSTIAGTVQDAWHGALADGSLAKNQWIWTKPYEGVQLARNIDKREAEEQRWFRTNANGSLVKDQTKKINGKWYAFDADGAMAAGLVVLTDTKVNKSGVKITDIFTVADTEADTLKALGLAKADKIHFFSNDEAKDGSMKTGTIKLELASGSKTFCFDKTTGASKHGVDTTGKKIYEYGMLVTAGDAKYAAVKVGNKMYLITASGSIVTSAGRYKDANDLYYVIAKGGSLKNGYTIYRYDDEDAAKEAVAKQQYNDLNKVTESTVED